MERDNATLDLDDEKLKGRTILKARKQERKDITLEPLGWHKDYQLHNASNLYYSFASKDSSKTLKPNKKFLHALFL